MSDNEKDEDPLSRLKRAMENASDETDKPEEGAVDPLSADNIKNKVKNSGIVIGLLTGLQNLGQGAYQKSKYIRWGTDTANYIWNSKWGAVLTTGGTWVAQKYWQASKWAFKKYTFDENGEYSAKKGASFAVPWALATGYGAYYGATRVVPLALMTAFNFTYDAVAINGFSNEGVFVFQSPREIEGSPGEFRVRACLDDYCDSRENTVEFRIRDSVYLNVVEGINGFFNDSSRADVDWLELYDPTEVAGGFLRESNVCYVEYHLTRNRTWGRFPIIQYAYCEDAAEGNVTTALEDMKARYNIGDDMPSPL